MLTPGIAAGSTRWGFFLARAYYFLFFMAIGCLAPFFNVYLERTGLTGVEIGWLGSIPPMVALVANPFWGAVADRYQVYRYVLALCAFLAGLVTLFFLWQHNFWPLLGLVTALSFFRTPIGSIIDSTVMDLVKRTPGSSYGQQRWWGTVGFVVATLGLAQFVIGDNLELIFWLHGGILGLACAGLSFFLPVQTTGVKVNLLAGLRRLAGQRPYFSFLLAMTLLGMSYSTISGFLGLHLLALGGTERQIGLAWGANALAEIPVMYYGARWFGAYSHKRLIVIGFWGFALIWTLAALAPTPILVIAALPGMGICFGMFWVAAVSYASEAAPPGLSATAQALMGAAQSGLGWGLGSVIAGYLWDRTNGHVVLSFAAVAVVLASLFFIWGNRRA